MDVNLVYDRREDLTEKPLAAVYVRVSTTSQASPDKVSPQRQLDDCLRAAKRDGYKVSKSRIFEDHVSGTSSVRPSFEKMMQAAREGSFSRLYVWAQDRLTRSKMASALNILEDLDTAGVAVTSVQDGELTDELLNGIRAWVADRERKRIAERTAPAKRRKRDAGYWVSGTIPHGYIRGPNQTLEVEPVTAANVRQLFNWSIEGRGRTFAARELNKQGVPPPFLHLRIPNRSKPLRIRSSDFAGSWDRIKEWMAENDATFANGTQPCWHPDNVYKLLSKTIYMGELHNKPMLINPAPIIDKRTFDRATQAMRGRNMKGAGVRSTKLLTGMIRCGSCGRSYISHQGGHKKFFYICDGRRAANGCTSPGVSMVVADNHVIKMLREYLASRLSLIDFETFLASNVARKKGELEDERQAIRQNLKQLESRRKALTDSLIAAVGAGIEKELLPDITKPLNEVTSEIDILSRKERSVIDDIHRQAAEDERAASMAGKAAVEAYETSMLDSDPDCFGYLPVEAVREILILLSLKCKVQPDKSIELAFDETDDGLAIVIRYLSDRSMQTVRFERDLIDYEGWKVNVKTL